jgi:hypothetical protein
MSREAFFTMPETAVMYPAADHTTASKHRLVVEQRICMSAVVKSDMRTGGERGIRRVTASSVDPL